MCLAQSKPSINGHHHRWLMSLRTIPLVEHQQHALWAGAVAGVTDHRACLASGNVSAWDLTSWAFMELFQQKEKVLTFPVDSLLILFFFFFLKNIPLIRMASSFLLSFLFPLSLSLEVHLFASGFLVTLSWNASFRPDLNSSRQFG